MNQRLYPTGSRSVEGVVLSVHEEIQTFLQGKGTLSLSRNGERFFVDKKEVDASTLLVQVFEDHEIQGVTFDPGCPAAEVRILIQGLSEKHSRDESFADWLTTQKVSHIHVTQTRVMEVSEDEAVVAKGLSQFHALESSQEMRTALKTSLDYIDTIPEKTMKENLRQHLAQRLVLMEATLLKDLFDADLGLGDGGVSVLEDVLAALHQNKLLELLNETLRWDLRLQTAGKTKEWSAEREKLKTMVAKLSTCSAAKKIPYAVFEELTRRGLLEKVPDHLAMDTSQDLMIVADRLLALTDAELLKGGGRNLAELLGSLLAAGFQDRAKDIVLRIRAVLLEGDLRLRERAAQWARRFLPILWARLREDLVDRLRDAFFASAREERAGPVVREVLGALADDLIHNYRARHTRIAMEEAVMLCAIREKKDSVIPEGTESAGEGLRRAVDELVDLLAEDVHSKEKDIQEAAHALLSQVGDLAIPVFMKIVLNTRDRALRSLAAERLHQCGVAGTRALASQLNMGNTTNALLNVLSALGKGGGDEILEGLGTLLRYPDPDLRHAVVRILARIPGDKSSELALKFLGDSKESIRRLAADILGDRKYNPAVSSLMGLLGQPSVEEAETVCLALGRIGDPIAAEPLSRILKDKFNLFSKGKSGRETVRIRAAWALAQLGPAGQAQLRPYREDENPTVRDIALKAGT